MKKLLLVLTLFAANRLFAGLPTHGLNAEAGVDPDVVTKLQAFQSAGKTIRNIVFAPGGGWVVLLDGETWSEGVPEALTNQLKACDKEKEKVRIVGFTANRGWYLVADENTFYSDSAPADLGDMVKYLQGKNSAVAYLTLDANDAWTVGTTAGDYFFGGTPSLGLVKHLKGDPSVESTSYALYSPDTFVVLYTRKAGTDSPNSPQYKFDYNSGPGEQGSCSYLYEVRSGLLEATAAAVTLTGKCIVAW